MDHSDIQTIDPQKLENYRCFVNSAQEILEEGGISKLSIRKIADRAGFHNSTIYLYFKDLDQLTMLASMKYFQEYSQALELQSQKNLPAKENFIAIWELFVYEIIKEPCIFYNFFFGRRSDNLKAVMNMYYEIFPEERDRFSEDIEKMYFGNDIFERSLGLLQTLIGEDCFVTEDNLVMLNEITVCYCEHKLMKKCQNPKIDSAKARKEILDVIWYVTGV